MKLIEQYKKDGYHQQNVRQFLQSALGKIWLPRSRESRRYVADAFTRLARVEAFGYVKRV